MEWSFLLNYQSQRNMADPIAYTEEKYMTTEVKVNEKEKSPDLQGVAEMYG